MGVSCTEEGLFLGCTALVEHRAGRYAVRPQSDLERLVGRAFGNGVNLDRLMPGFRVVASALDEKNLRLAQIAAVQLRMPDLPDDIARRGMEDEDLLIKRARGGEDDRLARAGWDPAEHPRPGVPPNRGRFADKPAEVAQGEEDERAPEELPDPEAPVRQALWNARIATLRQIDPDNAQLTYVTAPGWVPSEADLEGLDAAIKAAAIKRVTDKVMPGGCRSANPDGVATFDSCPAGRARLEICSIFFGLADQRSLRS